MPSSLSEQQTAAEQTDRRVWNAFVCQDCRGIFRIPSDYEGKGVVCPCCDRMLRIPRAGESLPALVQSSDTSESNTKPQEYAPNEPARSMEEIEPVDAPAIPDATEEETPLASTPPAQSGEWRRRRKHRDRSKDAESDWQQESGQKRSFSRKVPVLWWWGTAALALAIVTAVMVALLQENPKKFNSTAVQSVHSTPIVLPVAEAKTPDADTLLHLTRLNEGYAAIEKFFAADRIESLLPLLRPIDGLEEKVRRFYRPEEFKMLPMDGIEKSTAQFLAGHQALQVQILLENLPPRTITLIRLGDVYRVDWESWVGWSEMDVASLKRIKPTQLTEVRVVVERVSYYNYDFPSSGESQWQSYRLTFAHSDEVIHGYIERSSPVSDEMQIASDQTSRPMTLRIRYRDATSHSSQVLIDSVVADGWVTDMPR